MTSAGRRGKSRRGSKCVTTELLHRQKLFLFCFIDAMKSSALENEACSFQGTLPTTGLADKLHSGDCRSDLKWAKIEFSPCQLLIKHQSASSRSLIGCSFPLVPNYWFIIGQEAEPCDCNEKSWNKERGFSSGSRSSSSVVAGSHTETQTGILRIPGRTPPFAEHSGSSSSSHSSSRCLSGNRP